MKKILPVWLKKIIKQFLSYLNYCIWTVKAEYNNFFLESLVKKNKKIHLGCGDIKLDGFINIDYRATSATDITKDCNNLDFLPSRSIKIVYANAFLEHLYLSQRQQCIDEIYRVLNDQGQTIILSIPDFEEIAKAYLKKREFEKNKLFDLYEVYRFTHGEPEQAPTWWIQQLHKSLFDTKTIISLMKNAGFSYFVIFRCSFANELTSVNLGVIAYKKKPKGKEINKKTIEEIFTSYKLNFNTKTISIVYNSF